MRMYLAGMGILLAAAFPAYGSAQTAATKAAPVQPQASTTVVAPASAAVDVPAPASPQTAPGVVTLSTPATNVLRASTQIQLKMSEGLTTKGKNLRVGQRFNMEVVEAVVLNGQTVIPVGSPAIGEVTEVRNKGMWGKSGAINARVLYLRANGRQIRLTGSIDDKGVTGTAGVVAAVAFVPVAGFFMTGTSAELPLGAPVKAFLDEDITVEFGPTVAPVPMAVPTAAATPVVPPAAVVAPE